MTVILESDLELALPSEGFELDFDGLPRFLAPAGLITALVLAFGGLPRFFLTGVGVGVGLALAAGSGVELALAGFAFFEGEEAAAVAGAFRLPEASGA